MNTGTALASERVAAGAKALDRVRPGWAAEIDTTKLNLLANNDCVIGQLWGSFIHESGRVAKLIDHTVDEPYADWKTQLRPVLVNHGFIGDVAADVSPELLRQCWLIEISNRRT